MGLALWAGEFVCWWFIIISMCHAWFHWPECLQAIHLMPAQWAGQGRPSVNN